MRTPIDLYALLPAVYRLRDAERGEPLRALLAVISEQAEMLRDDLDGMWDDLFVETADEWVVPYIGDLVANTPLHEIPDLSRRVDVANTIHWRRRKGTLAMLGDLARSVTGWGVHAVASFELLGWNQHLEHLRMQDGSDPLGSHPMAQERVGTVDLRARDAVDRIGTAFETATHTVDVRAIDDDDGWYGIRKVAFFCFRLQSFPLRAVTPVTLPGPGRRFALSPLGQVAPVFHLGVPLDAGQAFATEANVDAPIRAYRFFEDPQLDYGAGASLLIRHGATAVPVTDLICKNLETWPDVPADKIGVDVRRGLISIGSAYPLSGPVTVDHTYGFSAPIGGGPYRRIAQPEPATPQAEFVVAAGTPLATVEGGLAQWVALGSPAPDARIVIDDSSTYVLSGGQLDLTNAATAARPVDLTIAAGDEQRPVLVGDLVVSGITIDVLTLDGLVISGAVKIAGAVGKVVLRDCTLVPGIALTLQGAPTQPAAPSLVCDQPSDRREVVLERCITGPLRLAAQANELSVCDSIIDAPEPPTGARLAIAADATGYVAGPPTSIERTTVLGSVFVRELVLGSESLFTEGAVVAERRQSGCMRFCWVEPIGSDTPRRYRCQPDLVAAAAVDTASKLREIRRVRPSFTSTAYGQPGYLQLAGDAAPEILEGAQDGAEIGAFHLLMAPYRATNLRVRLEEYLPMGLEPGIVHVT